MYNRTQGPACSPLGSAPGAHGWGLTHFAFGRYCCKDQLLIWVDTPQVRFCPRRARLAPSVMRRIHKPEPCPGITVNRSRGGKHVWRGDLLHSICCPSLRLKPGHPLLQSNALPGVPVTTLRPSLLPVFSSEDRCPAGEGSCLQQAQELMLSPQRVGRCSSSQPHPHESFSPPFSIISGVLCSLATLRDPHPQSSVPGNGGIGRVRPDVAMAISPSAPTSLPLWEGWPQCPEHQ